MSWIRIDDNFPDHPKAVGLRTDSRRFTWVRVLAYTCRYRSPNIPAGIGSVIPGATDKFLRDCIELRLIDVDQTTGALVVHDWNDYQAGNPKKAARQARWREGVDARVDATVDAHVDAGLDDGVDASRAGAPRASRPVPSRSTYTPTSSVQGDDDDRSKIEGTCDLLGFTQNQRARALTTEPELLLAIASHALAVGDNPGGLAWTMLTTGQDPRSSKEPTLAAGATGTRSTSKPTDALVQGRKWIAGQAWDETYDLDAASEELQRVVRKARANLDAPTLAVLLEEWHTEAAKRNASSLIEGAAA